MDNMDDNPLFGVSLSDVSSDGSSSSSSDGRTATAVASPPVAVLQTVNIKSHVPVVHDLAAPNYDEWRCCFDAFIGKFGIGSHLSSPLTPKQCHDPAWLIIDQCILSLLYNSVSKDVLAIVRVPKATAGTRSMNNSATTSFIVPSIWRPSSAALSRVT